MEDLKKDFIQQLINELPPGFSGISQELKAWLHTFVSDWLAQHDLVTQQEFEVQCKILNRLRDRVETLESKLSNLQNQALPEHEVEN